VTTCFCERCGEPTSEPGECPACTRGAELESGAVPPIDPERVEPNANAIMIGIGLFLIALSVFYFFVIEWQVSAAVAACGLLWIIGWRVALDAGFATVAGRQRREARRRARRALRRLERIPSAGAGKTAEGFVRIRGRVRVEEPIDAVDGRAPIAARVGAGGRMARRFEVVDATGSVRIEGAEHFELWDPRVEGDGSVAIGEGDEVEVFGRGELVADPSSADRGYRDGPLRALVLRSAPGEPVEVVVRGRRKP
jgi:hypothetical protein